MIDINLDEINKLYFNIMIEGTEAPTNDPVIRLVCNSNKLSYIFEGKWNDENEISVTIPLMKNLIKEGSYDSQLEVIIDDKFFIPLKPVLNFQKPLNVTAEAVQKTKQTKKLSENKVTATFKTTTKEKIVEQKEDNEDLKRNILFKFLND